MLHSSLMGSVSEPFDEVAALDGSEFWLALTVRDGPDTTILLDQNIRWKFQDVLSSRVGCVMAS